MFGGGATNPYDEIVAKATDENQTSENWEIILNLCDKVQDEGSDGAKNAVAALIKRLAHRNPNVQLYALSLAEALTKNLGIELHRELASKAFTQALERIIGDRTTHDKVKRRALQLVAECAETFENDTSLGIMEDLYNSLKSKGHKFDGPTEAPPPAADDEIRRKEEEELQRVLEMSMHDKGGRGAWADYSLAAGSGSGSGTGTGGSGAPTSKPLPSTSGYAAPKYQSGYVPARTPSPATQQRYRSPEPEPEPQRQPVHHAPAQPQAHHSQPPHSYQAPRSPSPPVEPPASNLNIVTRVRALHTFEPSEPGELAFNKGDIIKVVDRGYKDWWRGQLKGRTGIFPVNYVEPMPEPTASELAKEAEQEASVFSQAADVERLLNSLRTLDPDKDNLADNEEIQELYRSCMSLRPKIVKLIDKYSQKRADLVSMNETFIRARTIFDRMMEESLARHTGVYDQPPYRPSQYPQGPAQGRPNQRPPVQPTSAPQSYGWNPNVYQQPGYNAYPATAAAYTGQQPQQPSGPQPYPPQAAPAPAPATAYQPQQPQQPPQQPAGPQPYPPVQAAPAPAPVPGPTPAAAPQPQAYGYSAPYAQPAYTAQPPQVQQPPAQPQVQAVPQAPAPQPQAQPPPAQTRSQSLLDEEPLPDPYSVSAAQPPQASQLPQALQPTKAVQSPVNLTQSPVPFAQPAQQQPLFSAPPAVAQPPLQQNPSLNSVPQVQAQPLQPTPVAHQSPVEQVQHVQPLQQVQPQPQVQVQAQPIQQQALQRLQQQPEVLRSEPILQQAQPQPAEAYEQPQAQTQPQRQPQRQNTLPQAAPVQQQPEPVAEAQPAPVASVDNGPPYVYSPTATYADPNVQAWASYYAQGGTDVAGAVYFISVPGVKPAPSAPAAVEAGAGGVSRNTSYQAGGAAAQGQQVAQPVHSEQPTAAASVVGPHAKRYQLTDTGFLGGSKDTMGPSYVSSPDSGASQPLGQQQPAGPDTGASAAAGPFASPAQSTPSWVLPKRGTA